MKTSTIDKIKVELANSISHGLGVLFGIIAIPLLVSTAIQSGSVSAAVGSAIYGFSFMMVFASSTIYHSVFHPTLKYIFKIIDHISIYFLIAGTYTPFILLFSFNTTGIALLCVLWGLSFIGIFFKILFVDRFNFLSMLIYLAMGWSIVVLPESFFLSLPQESWVLIVVGGGLYTVGVLFYLWESFTYHHMVWHLFVLSASICHFVAILLAIV